MPSSEPDRLLSSKVVAFCERLRGELHFGIGPRDVRDALRALDVIGIAERERVRTALRLVCCTTHAETLSFGAAFDAFFDETPQGIAQTAYAPRHTREGPGNARADEPRRSGTAKNELPDDEGDAPRNEGERRRFAAGASAGDEWQALRARYSSAPGRGAPLEFTSTLHERMRPAVARLISRVRLGRSRNVAAASGTGRFDLRRTVRASFRTYGDPVRLRFRAHLPRKPRFVMLVDGSRSMSDHTAAVVAFAAALCERNARTNVFFFSTALREVTEDLRRAVRDGAPFGELGEAWGGGTKIGTNLARFVSLHGALLSKNTLVLVYSDGLDVGDIRQLTDAMRDIDNRSAGIVWLNPHAATAGYVPSARGMRAALPFVSLLCSANDVPGFERLASRVAL